MKISKELIESIQADCHMLCGQLGIDLATADGGNTGLKTMYALLDRISFDRAYNNEHPAFVAGRKRILPYDGRDYCFYYANGCNDTHLATALRHIKANLIRNLIPA